jgi:light-regulated signal transduction histidine kinase (bacteriophytochrome)
MIEQVDLQQNSQFVQLTEELQTAEAPDLVDLALRAAHNLNNCMTAVMGYAQLLYYDNRGTETGERSEKIISGAQEACQILRELVYTLRQHRGGPVKEPTVI